MIARRAVGGAAQILENAGIPKQKINTRIIQGAKSRAGAIVTAAKQENCDTIVSAEKANPR